MMPEPVDSAELARRDALERKRASREDKLVERLRKTEFFILLTPSGHDYQLCLFNKILGESKDFTLPCPSSFSKGSCSESKVREALTRVYQKRINAAIEDQLERANPCLPEWLLDKRAPPRRERGLESFGARFAAEGYPFTEPRLSYLRKVIRENLNIPELTIFRKRVTEGIEWRLRPTEVSYKKVVLNVPSI